MIINFSVVLLSWIRIFPSRIPCQNGTGTLIRIHDPGFLSRIRIRNFGCIPVLRTLLKTGFFHLCIVRYSVQLAKFWVRPDLFKNFGSGSAINNFFCDLLDQPGVEVLVGRLHDVPPLLRLINLPAVTDKGTIRIFFGNL
jgi:hypothetical protein